MADDFGDDAGQRMYDILLRAGMELARRHGSRGGERALEEAAQRLESALSEARDRLADDGTLSLEADGSGVEFAKLDLAELKQLDCYEEVRSAIDAGLDRAGVAHGFVDGEAGKTHLVFRLSDATKVASCIDELTREVAPASARASEEVRANRGRKGQSSRDQEPLKDRAARTRAAAESMASQDRERTTERARGLGLAREERTK